MPLAAVSCRRVAAPSSPHPHKIDDSPPLMSEVRSARAMGGAALASMRRSLAFRDAARVCVGRLAVDTVCARCLLCCGAWLAIGACASVIARVTRMCVCIVAWQYVRMSVVRQRACHVCVCDVCVTDREGQPQGRCLVSCSLVRLCRCGSGVSVLPHKKARLSYLYVGASRTAKGRSVGGN